MNKKDKIALAKYCLRYGSIDNPASKASEVYLAELIEKPEKVTFEHVLKSLKESVKTK